MKQAHSPILITACLSLSFGAIAVACNVPVFRYALERWPADKYEVIVLHHEILRDADLERIKRIRFEQQKATAANFNLRVIDIAQTDDAFLTELWSVHSKAQQPLLAVLYPQNAREVPDRVVSVVPFDEQATNDLADSPLRQKLAKQLLSGDSAVWIFVPCGNKDQDDAARRTLTEQVQRNEDSLELPPQDEIEKDEFYREENPIELKIGFSIITLDRKDPREQLLLQMLLGSESDLEDIDQPMAFPVIGRGRVLYGLVGKGIFADTVAMASRFVVGPCSCQVKDQNPGFDLMLSVDWDKELGGAVISKPSTEKSSKPVLIEIPTGK
ncbi:MAG: hypothetical protein AB8B91_13810 [Rubripirellula sp.]